MEARRFTYSGSMKISRSDMALLRAGRKKCTVRLGTATVADSEIVMTDGRTSVPVRILNVDSSKCFSDLTDQDAMDEGFHNREELWRDLKQYYPRAADNDPVTVIHFEAVNAAPSLFDK